MTENPRRVPLVRTGDGPAREYGTCAIVVPCYNEASRLDSDAFAAYAEHRPDIRFVFVNDGSQDDTLTLLRRMQSQTPAFHVIENGRNLGKAESVRAGLLYGLSLPGVEAVGFWDADLATPLTAIQDLLGVLEERPDIDVVIGSRVKLLGRNIQRRPARHYLGRIFATLASVSLRLPVYDTQCGAKLFRATAVLENALEEPFLSRWIFDVELIARFIYLRTHHAVMSSTYEFPLHSWRDVPGSKVNAAAFVKAATELWRIYRKYRSRGNASSPAAIAVAAHRNPKNWR